MGKISKALDKYAGERKAAESEVLPAASPLTHDDILTLVAYDENTGHLLKADPATGNVDGEQIEALRASGTILRLLENGLIYPGGKLTRRGIEEAVRLTSMAAAIPKRPAAKTADTSPPAAAYAPVVNSQSPAAGQPLPEDTYGGASPLPAHSGEEFIEPHGASAGLKPEEPLSAAVPKPLTVVSDSNHSVSEVFSLPKRIPERKARGAKQRPTWDDAAIDPGLVTLIDPQSHEAEQFKILRTNILFPLAGSPPRSILVTSACQGEGKTFTASNLAISIALNINRHVLLIDADMRLPQIHTRFGFGAVPGLSNYLSEGSPLPSLLLKTKIDKLSLLPAGTPPNNPAELVSSERMSNLLTEVSNRYPDRIVVIDAPPPAMAAETGVLARQVDGILVVVRFGSTCRDDLADLVSRVGEKKILGSVVNYIETNASRYYGYKYGGYGRSSKK